MEHAAFSDFDLLAEHCNCIAKYGYCHDMLSVCLSSVTPVYCDKTAKARITRFSVKVAKCLISYRGKFDSEIRQSSS